MPVEITRENFTAAIRAAVADKGADYMYPAEERISNDAEVDTCVYAHDGQPSCLIGHALYRIDPEYLTEIPKHDNLEYASADDVLSVFGVVDEALLRAANAAQFEQDHNRSWGVALELYEIKLAQGE